ncbi:GNAT family N-acetyltransferase [Candidatus Microgenomates bacterium]|nr:GNAT family N-acetyltransferase [Candidatus Microgenomates bacterium]
MKKFKNQLFGKRIILKRTKPNLKTASIMFETIDKNREHLGKWFPWEKFTKKIEDSIGYLFEKEKLTKVGKKIEYGIYVNGNYVGNISVFDINLKKKSGEIGYWISAKFARQGYVSEAVSVLEKEFFANFGLNRIQIQCDEENNASAGVAKKCKYYFEGKLRENSYDEHRDCFRNTLVFSKLRKEFNRKKK